jgi:hypothetical protein
VFARIPAVSGLAIFAAQSAGDVGGGNLPAVVKASTHPTSTMKSDDGSAHGVSLFVKDRGLRPAIVQWLQSVMK